MINKYLCNEIELVRHWASTVQYNRNLVSNSLHETTDSLLILALPRVKHGMIVSGMAIRIIVAGNEKTDSQTMQLETLRENNFVASDVLDAEGARDSIMEYLGL